MRVIVSSQLCSFGAISIFITQRTLIESDVADLCTFYILFNKKRVQDSLYNIVELIWLNATYFWTRCIIVAIISCRKKSVLFEIRPIHLIQSFIHRKWPSHFHPRPLRTSLLHFLREALFGNILHEIFNCIQDIRTNRF